jgi:hypothetical protein
MKSILLHLLLLVIIGACQQPKKNEEKAIVQRMSVTETRHKGKLNLDDLIIDYRIVALDYPKMIAELSEVHFTKDKMCVRDKKNIALLEFTIDGKSIKSFIYGQNKAFWFALGVGTIGGLMMSLLVIFFYLPLFLVKGAKR